MNEGKITITKTTKQKQKRRKKITCQNGQNEAGNRKSERFNLYFFSFFFKDGAYFYYYAYVLCISRYLGFLLVVPSNTGIFLRGFKLFGESRT